MNKQAVSSGGAPAVRAPAARQEMDRRQAALVVSVLLFAVLYLWGIATGLAALSQAGSKEAAAPPG
jgi:hypothetical protein